MLAQLWMASTFFLLGLLIGILGTYAHLVHHSHGGDDDDGDPA